ncbi:MAG: hypothetical protein ACOYON_02890 [Fimbriimonas sp.]
MIWTQGMLSFVFWIGYGVWRSRHSEALRLRLAALPNSKKLLGGVAYLLGGVIGLFAGLIAVQSAGGLTPTGMLPWAWLAVTIIGFGFVHCQTEGTAHLVSLAQESVRAEKAVTSKSIDTSGKPDRTGSPE